MAKAYVGLANTLHDTSLAIINAAGELVFAEATERYLQNKRAINVMPDLLFRTGELIKEYCCGASDFVAAFSWSGESSAAVQAHLGRSGDQEFVTNLLGTVSSGLQIKMARERWLAVSQLAALSFAGTTLDYELAEAVGAKPAEKRRYHHHLTHAAAAVFASPFDEGVCIVLDGVGESTACSAYRFKPGKLEPLDLGPLPNNMASLGVFYSDVCEACGFSSLAGEEWKVMGLAPYGRRHDEAYRLFCSMISVRGGHLSAPHPGRQLVLAQRLEGLARKRGAAPITAADLAFTGQEVFSEILFKLLNNIHGICPVENLVLTGGCALNSSANGKIVENTPFNNLFVPSAPGDDGNAVGAAILAFCEDNPGRSPAGVSSPYLGSRMCADTLEKMRRFSGFGRVSECGNEAPRHAARLLSEGKLIGWIQGAAEFGPRALGNRSILADPRSPDVKALINAKVKFREEFRPFAPSILHEHGASYFENYQETRYMERTLRFKSEVRGRVPGVVHQDGTGRLQTVKREWNEPFYQLISAFYERTGIPLVLNTSFNVMGKPISHSVEDVMAVFCTSGLDAVFIDGVLAEKQ